jgi:hypothetical protein
MQTHTQPSTTPVTIESKNPVEEKMQETLDVFSFDFDGCLWGGTRTRTTPSGLIKLHEPLLKTLAKKVTDDKCSEVIVMIGTNRQSRIHDLLISNHNKSPSCFPAYHELNNQFAKMIDPVPCKLDPHLMTDTQHGLKSGESYSKAAIPNEKHPTCVFDHTKVTLLLLQMQKIASENPNKKINYHFIDDRLDILNQLKNVFEHHPDLIPSNVTLHLHRYKYLQSSPTPIFSTQGTGRIDINYRNTLNQFWGLHEEIPDNHFADIRNIHRLKRIAEQPYLTTHANILFFQNKLQKEVERFTATQQCESSGPCVLM